MPRPLRPPVPGATYHVTARGVDRCDVYRDVADRTIFVRLLARVVEVRDWRVLAYCLMGNHYHLLLTTPDGDLSRGMQWLNGRYARRFNDRHGRTGALWQGRFHSSAIGTEAHLLLAARYVVLNPVRAGLCADPADWPWSSHRAALGLDAPAVPAGGLPEILGDAQGRSARERYAAFVGEDPG